MINKEQIRADETKFVQPGKNTWDPYHFGLKSVFARLDVQYEDQVKRWTACASFREKSRRESPFFAVLVLVSSYVHYHDRECQETDNIHPRYQSWCLPCFQCSFGRSTTQAASGRRPATNFVRLLPSSVRRSMVGFGISIARIPKSTILFWLIGSCSFDHPTVNDDMTKRRRCLEYQSVCIHFETVPIIRGADKRFNHTELRVFECFASAVSLWFASAVSLWYRGDIRGVQSQSLLNDGESERNWTYRSRW